MIGSTVGWIVREEEEEGWGWGKEWKEHGKEKHCVSLDAVLSSSSPLPLSSILTHKGQKDEIVCSTDIVYHRTTHILSFHNPNPNPNPTTPQPQIPQTTPISP